MAIEKAIESGFGVGVTPNYWRVDEIHKVRKGDDGVVVFHANCYMDKVSCDAGKDPVPGNNMKRRDRVSLSEFAATVARAKATDPIAAEFEAAEILFRERHPDDWEGSKTVDEVAITAEGEEEVT